MRPICVILGPTASGKSALALEVARRTDALLLAVDSMTVYRGMDVGTAKPSAREREAVPHRAIDVVEPNQSFSTADWLTVAESALAEGKPVVACGGTPLYFQSLFRGLFEGPAADPGFRASLVGESDVELHARLAATDPASASRLHVNDRKRVVRALEVLHLTGRLIGELQRQWTTGPDRVPSVRFGLAWDRPTLNRRINARAKAMIEAGWLEEVRGLLDRVGTLSPTAGEAAGYKLLTQVANGRMKLDDALEQIKIRTRQLAKRQMTWFRRFEKVDWLKGEGPISANADRVLETWAP